MTQFPPHDRPRLRIRLGAAVALVAILAASVVTISGSAATTKNSAAKSPWNILYVSEQSGPLAVVGKAFLDGAIAGARILNATGGISGHKVTLKIVDDNSNPATAVGLLQQELGTGNYQEVVTDVAAVSSVLAPIIAAHPQIIAAGASATGTETVQAVPNMYFTGPARADDRLRGRRLREKEWLQVDRCCHARQRSGHSYGAFYQQLGQADGMSVSVAYAPATTLDATPQLQQLLRTNPTC